MDDCLACRVECIPPCIPDSHPYRVQNTKCRIDSYFSWWWAHSHPKHVEKRNKHTKRNCAPSWLYLQDEMCILFSTAAHQYVWHIKGKHKEVQSGYMISGSRFWPSASRIWNSSANTYSIISVTTAIWQHYVNILICYKTRRTWPHLLCPCAPIKQETYH